LEPLKPVERQAISRIEPMFDQKKIGAYPKTQELLGSSKIDVNKLLAAARKTPDLSPIEWDGDRSSNDAGFSGESAGSGARATSDEDPRTFDARRRKIRDRYISARCPGVARSAADFESASKVIKSARLYFEDDEPATALELLDLAIEEIPHESSLWLARLEILFLTRDRYAFVAGARAFREAHPAHGAWNEIERLGRAIAPSDALFGNVVASRDHEHYGPWPHLPNWIQAPWDLTSDAHTGDAHRAMSRHLQPACKPRRETARRQTSYEPAVPAPRLPRGVRQGPQR
jgi:hypothetical protein